MGDVGPSEAGRDRGRLNCAVSILITWHKFAIQVVYQLSVHETFSCTRAMPKAVKGTSRPPLPVRMMTDPTMAPGVLIECDPSIKAIILKIDSDAHDYIVEDLDDQTLVIKESQLQRLKARLEEVCMSCLLGSDRVAVVKMGADVVRCRSWQARSRCQIANRTESSCWSGAAGAIWARIPEE